MLKNKYNLHIKFKIIFLLFFSVFSFVTCNYSKEEKKIPSFTLKNLKGEELKLSDLRGRVTIIDFWATWCPPCRDLMPNLTDLYKKYNSKGLNIIGIVVNSGSADKISKFVEKFKITYPILKGSDTVYKDFGYIRVLPTIFILNQKGEVYKKYIGYIDKKYLEHEIKKLLDYKK
jgi:thiol-disulfide isomerase/thioredoxin